MRRLLLTGLLALLLGGCATWSDAQWREFGTAMDGLSTRAFAISASMAQEQRLRNLEHQINVLQGDVWWQGR